MKVFFYEVKDYEIEYVKKYALKHGFILQGYTHELLSLDNLELSAGCDAVSTLGFSRADNQIFKRLAENGVKYFCTRTIGYDHVDIASANKYGVRVMRAQYNSSNVADYTVMLILMAVRKAKVTFARSIVNNFSLEGNEGRDVSSLTIGVVGTGKIGAKVIKNLLGFGCKLICYDVVKNTEVEKYCTYVSFEELCASSDVISLHVPLTSDNYHMIDKDVIDRMKNGVVIINTARGALIDTEALVCGLESGKIGGAGLDTVEGEEGICHADLKTRVVPNENKLFYLKQLPNVIYTPHIAFFTEEAFSQMVESVFWGIECAENGKDSIYAVNP